MKKTNGEKQWYARDVQDVVRELSTNEQAGLDSSGISVIRNHSGWNKLPEKKKEGAFIRFLKHFNDILIYILLIASVITAILGHYADTAVILLVAVINAAIGFFQENKAEKALDAIRDMLSLKAQVIRNGAREEIDAEELVPGDIVILNPGDKVPADIRLTREDNLAIEESALTGESVPSEKTTGTLDANTELGDRTNMAFSGTTVSAGTGTGIVVATGESTELGKINRMISEVEPLCTPLLRQTNQFGKTVSLVIVIISVLIFVFAYFFRDYPLGELAMSVIGLAVAAIPEGLPAILSIILAIGVQNMARKNAIIRNLPSVETLGSVSVICSDKTGTLTRNEMTVKTLAAGEKTYDVEGTGYQPEGKITLEGGEVTATGIPVLKKLLSCFRICNEASLAQDEEGHWQIQGDPTEGALITAYEKAGLEMDLPRRIATLPFDSAYKYMATLVETGEGHMIYIKGAPDKLLDMSASEAEDDGEKELDRSLWEKKMEATANEGKRLLGAAYKKIEGGKDVVEHQDLAEGIVFIGFAGIIDPPRQEAIEAVEECKHAGIDVKMITGDHADTARAIGRELGIGDGIRAIQGKDLEQMDDDELMGIARDYDIFARTSPEHKLRLVTALQKLGKVCAMTGDGVNDAPALKKADVGIAMGIKGTEVTKDASEMVLADDNFRTIVSAVREGRRVYDNLKKTILFILPTNGAESFLIIASILFGTMMPLTPIQVLWVNMVTSVTVSLALAFEPAESDIMDRSPRPSRTPLLSGYFIWRIMFVSVLIGGGTLFINILLQDDGLGHAAINTITLQTIVVAQMFHLFNSRSIQKPAFCVGFFTNKAVYVVCGLLVLLQLAITYIPFMNGIFGTAPLEWSAWKYPFILGVTVFVLVEIEKAIVRRAGIKVV